MMRKDFDYDEFINNLSEEDANRFLDNILADIRGTATNGDGGKPTGMISEEDD